MSGNADGQIPDLMKRYEYHPLGKVLEHMLTSDNQEALASYSIMVMAMAELMAWQGGIDITERDALQQLAIELMEAGTARH